MPYAGGNASMLLLLPHDMEDFLGGFGEETLAEVDRILTRTNVDLTMPRFEYSESISLGDILVSMGMETAFTTEANFTPMTGSPDLFISQVLHKAYVKVDEKGTEAAAATAVLMALTAAPRPGADDAGQALRLPYSERRYRNHPVHGPGERPLLARAARHRAAAM